MGKDNPLQHYLATYAEAEARLVLDFAWSQSFDHVVVIPAYDEQAAFLSPLQHYCRQQRALMVLIVNQPTTVSHCDNNAFLWRFLLDHTERVQSRAHLHLFNWEGAWILAVDRFQPERRLKPQQGVGLARKIGCDVASALINAAIICSPWIHSTDADAKLPADYFHRLAQIDGSAAIYPFTHCGDAGDPVTTATQLYEQSLRYYVDGLRWAGSPYAFHTIGSCLAIRAFSYCQARGFPKRAGGEDFYLLNKLAKLGPVISLPGKPITIQARYSQRTPFGTGPAVAKLLALPGLQHFHSYNPWVFVELKDLLKTLSNWWHVKERQADLLAGMSDAINSACRTLEIDQLFRHLCKQAHTPDTALRHIHYWFDGFRTLKFIHLLQGNYYPPIPFQEALAQTKTLFNSSEEV